MSWTYSGDPSTSSMDMVRFTIADTDTTDQKLTNEEINTFLGLHDGKVSLTTLTCVKYLMTKYAGECDYKIGPEAVSASQRYLQYRALYADLKGTYDNQNIAPQQESAPRIFSVGMMDDGDL